MECSLILTANAGVILTVGDRQFLIDALHKEKMPGFSAVPPDVLTTIWKRYQFRAPSAVIATHIHPDHISLSLWNEARQRWPSCDFLSPGFPLEGTVVLHKKRQSLSLAGVEVEAIRLPHEGNHFDSVVNYGYFLNIDGFTILIPGDCSISAAPMLSDLIGDRHVDLALLNFPWVTLSTPRAFVWETIAPSHLVLFHLPFFEDDTEGYRTATCLAAKMLAPMDIRLLSAPFQEIVIG